MTVRLIDGVAPERAPLAHVWSYCAGAGRANEALRADWQAQFREARERLGFEFVRFHGVFHDDMFVYRSSYGGGFGPDTPLEVPLHTYSYVDKVFDFLLDLGVKPFVELGFMPRDLATVTETVFWWGAHCSPPKDMNRWVELVVATVRHWIERYGIEEVRTWRFEIWNEPNLVPHFWTGTRTEYFELYEATARAIKAIDAGLLVGGPSTSVFVPDARYAGETEDRAAEVATAEAVDVDALDWRPVWIEEFLAWCAERDIAIDFLSTHLYPTDFAFGANGKGVHLSRHANATADDLTLLRDIIRESAYPDAEVHITEWSSSPSSRDRMHDTVFAATYIARAYLQCRDLADSISYWTFTDIFEEGGAGLGPFHGGFGLVNEQGIHKPTFHAFEMLSRLGDTVLAETPEGLISENSATGALSAVFFNYPDEMGGKSIGNTSSLDEALELAEIGAPKTVSHTIDGLQPGTAFVLETLDLEHGDVVAAWANLGAPLNLTREQTASLAARADTLGRRSLVADDGGTLHIELSLAPWAVVSMYQV